MARPEGARDASPRARVPHDRRPAEHRMAQWVRRARRQGVREDGDGSHRRGLVSHAVASRPPALPLRDKPASRLRRRRRSLGECQAGRLRRRRGLRLRAARSSRAGRVSGRKATNNGRSTDTARQSSSALLLSCMSRSLSSSRAAGGARMSMQSAPSWLVTAKTVPPPPVGTPPGSAGGTRWPLASCRHRPPTSGAQ